jgi:hypothetical protein
MDRKLNDNDDVLTQMRRLVTANTKTMSSLGTRAMVLGKSFDAVIPQLTSEQRARTAESFRHCIEGVMALMDDMPLPAEYHSALLGFWIRC